MGPGTGEKNQRGLLLLRAGSWDAQPLGAELQSAPHSLETPQIPSLEHRTRELLRLDSMIVCDSHGLRTVCPEAKVLQDP